MPKIQKMITLDQEVVNRCVEQELNVSKLCNDYLDQYTLTTNKREATDLRYLQAKQAKLDKEFLKVKSERDKNLSQLNTIKQNKEKQELERLEKEKEELEIRSKCNICGIKIEKPIMIKGKEVYKCLDCLHND